MDAITILKRCRGAEEDLERLRQRLQQRHEILTAIGAPQPDPIGGGRGSVDPDKYGRIMADIDQLERQMQSRQEDYRAEAAAAAALMDLVPDLEGKVLYSYYVRRMSVPAIAKKESYQPGYLRKHSAYLSFEPRNNVMQSCALGITRRWFLAVSPVVALEQSP